jgi:hypothetical protein
VIRRAQLGNSGGGATPTGAQHGRQQLRGLQPLRTHIVIAECTRHARDGEDTRAQDQSDGNHNLDEAQPLFASVRTRERRRNNLHRRSIGMREANLNPFVTQKPGLNRIVVRQEGCSPEGV